jgi:hypothetical protein
MSKDSYIPSSELDGQVSEHISWNLSLPPYVADRVGIHIDRLDRMASISGFGNIAVGGYAGERTAVIPEIAGIDDHGVAMASAKSVTTKAPLQRSWDEPRHLDTLYSFSEYMRPNVVLEVNTTELDRRVGDSGSVRNEKLWAKYLQESLRDGVEDLAVHNLALRKKFGDYWFSVCAIMPSMPLLNANSAPEALAMFLGVSQIWNLLNSAAAKRWGIDKEDKRLHSLFTGIPFDRLAVVMGMAKALPIVKPIKSSEE